jgi:hypothetical protein
LNKKAGLREPKKEKGNRIKYEKERKKERKDKKTK